MIAVAEALERILSELRPVATESVPLPSGWNRVLAEPLRSRLTQPPVDVSAMDGYAVRAGDAVAGATLRVVGEAPAGRPWAGRLAAGEAVRIFTGGALPAGADGILLQEDAEAAGDQVSAREAVQPDRWIRRRGLDFAAGDVLLPVQRRLTARDVGLAAAGNHPWLTVHRRPRIGILATGDEIALPGEPLPPAGIVSSNAHALSALVRAAGGEATVLPVARDDAGSIARAGRAAEGFDLLLTTGGASVGAHDLVQSALLPEGFQRNFWRVAMRPGKPLIWGRLRDVPLLGLPGNPVAAMVCGAVFLLPALAKLSGLPAAPTPTRPARTGRALPGNDQRQDYLRARLSADGAVATAAERQDSSMLNTLARADALLLRPPHAPPLPEGAAVEVIDLAPLGI